MGTILTPKWLLHALDTDFITFLDGLHRGADLEGVVDCGLRRCSAAGVGLYRVYARGSAVGLHRLFGPWGHKAVASQQGVELKVARLGLRLLSKCLYLEDSLPPRR